MKKLSKTRTKNLYRKTYNLINRYQRKGLGFIRYNQKTLICLDKGNICPKDKESAPCTYCYKADIDKCYKTYRNGKREYFRGDKVDMKKLSAFCREFKRLLKQYNRSDFSVRVFSFSDYMKENHNFWKTVLSVFRKYDIKLHAITKQHTAVGFLCRFCDTVNISIDALAERKNIRSAVELKKWNPDQIKIRSVILNETDSTFMQKLGIVDIHTFYHGSLKRGIKDLHNYSHAEVQARARTMGNVCCAEGEKAGKCINCMLCQ